MLTTWLGPSALAASWFLSPDIQTTLETSLYHDSGTTTFSYYNHGGVNITGFWNVSPNVKQRQATDKYQLNVIFHIKG